MSFNAQRTIHKTQTAETRFTVFGFIDASCFRAFASIHSLVSEQQNTLVQKKKKWKKSWNLTRRELHAITNERRALAIRQWNGVRGLFSVSHCISYWISRLPRYLIVARCIKMNWRRRQRIKSNQRTDKSEFETKCEWVEKYLHILTSS